MTTGIHAATARDDQLPPIATDYLFALLYWRFLVFLDANKARLDRVRA